MKKYFKKMFLGLHEQNVTKKLITEDKFQLLSYPSYYREI